MYDILIRRLSNTFVVKARQSTIEVISYGKRGVQGIQGETGRNPLTVSDTEPVSPQIGDIWYQP